MALTSVKINSNARQQFPGVFSNVTVASGVKDFGTIADGVDAQDTIAIPGVAAGDMILGVSSSANDKLTLSGTVAAAGSVAITAVNNTGGSVTATATAVYTVVVAKLV
jgi:hypothetical protein